MAEDTDSKVGLLGAADRSTRRPSVGALKQHHYPLRGRRWLRGLSPCALLLGLVLVFSVVGSAVWALNQWHPSYSSMGRTWSSALTESGALRKPPGIKIVGIVFFGRRQYFDILDCYLRRNLAINGGFLDEIHLLLHETAPDDVDYIRELVSSTPELQDQYLLFDYLNDIYSKLWSHCDEMATMYVKLDDDLIYVHEDAVPRLVTSLIKHPEAHSIQANLVQSGLTYWHHLHTDAFHSFVPEAQQTIRGKPSWRPSELPLFMGPINGTIDYDNLPNGHRWLPIANDNTERFEETPIYDVGVDGLSLPTEPDHPHKDWKWGAQALYSLLKNIEDDELDRYRFGSRDGIWNLWYLHYNINAMAIWGRNLWMKPFWEWDDDKWGDERQLTMYVPASLHMPSKVDTHAIVAHFSFRAQHRNMTKTDLLDRFRLYANEMVCAPNNQKTAFDAEAVEYTRPKPKQKPKPPPKPPAVPARPGGLAKPAGFAKPGGPARPAGAAKPVGAAGIPFVR